MSDLWNSKFLYGILYVQCSCFAPREKIVTTKANPRATNKNFKSEIHF